MWWNNIWPQCFYSEVKTRSREIKLKAERESESFFSTDLRSAQLCPSASTPLSWFGAVDAENCSNHRNVTPLLMFEHLMLVFFSFCSRFGSVYTLFHCSFNVLEALYKRLLKLINETQMFCCHFFSWDNIIHDYHTEKTTRVAAFIWTLYIVGDIEAWALVDRGSSWSLLINTWVYHWAHLYRGVSSVTAPPVDEPCICSWTADGKPPEDVTWLSAGVSLSEHLDY